MIIALISGGLCRAKDAALSYPGFLLSLEMKQGTGFGVSSQCISVCGLLKLRLRGIHINGDHSL